MKSSGERARRGRVFLVALLAAAVATLAATAAAGAGNGNGHAYGQDKPAKPAHDVPTASGLAGASVATSATVSPSGHGHGGNGAATTASPSGDHPAAPGAVGSTTLVLYDTTGAYGWLGELYATAVGNLASHFGTWHAEPVSSYQAGQIGQYTATVYVGSTYDEPLPASFLDDVHAATHPVVWIYDNIWELTNRFADFQSTYGWMWSQFDLSSVSQVDYKGTTLTRDAANNQAGIMGYSSVDQSKAQVLAWAVRDDGTRFPWALRSGSLTYVGENPFVYTTLTDRLIAFEDLLFDALNPNAPTRHRAMVRLEDLNPSSDQSQIRAVADYLYSQHIPFGFGVVSVYTDPNGYYTNGVAEESQLSDRRNGFADTLKYLIAHGGTEVMHGYTHQYSNVANPYTAVSTDDFEFYRVTENPDHTLDYQGPVAEDSPQWAAARLSSAFDEFRRAKLPAPTIFEFPHYAASVVDYQAAAQQFQTRWERALYFGGVLGGGSVDYGHVIGQGFPYVVHDVYGTTVLPETLGDYAPEPFYQFPPHTVADILAAGQANLAVRDGFGAFFYHPFEGVGALQQIVDGLRSQGWTFVSPADVAANG